MAVSKRSDTVGFPPGKRNRRHPSRRHSKATMGSPGQYLEGNGRYGADSVCSPRKLSSRRKIVEQVAHSICIRWAPISRTDSGAPDNHFSARVRSSFTRHPGTTKRSRCSEAPRREIHQYTRARSAPVRSCSCVTLEQARILPIHAAAVIAHRDKTRTSKVCSIQILEAPASRLFSTSSLTSEEGRSTTSPAATWLATTSGRRRIFPMPPDRAALAEPKTREILKEPIEARQVPAPRNVPSSTFALQALRRGGFQRFPHAPI